MCCTFMTGEKYVKLEANLAGFSKRVRYVCTCVQLTPIITPLLGSQLWGFRGLNFISNWGEGSRHPYHFEPRTSRLQTGLEVRGLAVFPFRGFCELFPLRAEGCD